MTSARTRAQLPADVFEHFPSVRGHLDAATSGVPPLGAVAAMREAVDLWAHGRIHGPAFDEAVERSRVAFARLVSVERANVAQSSSVSGFVGLIAAALPRGARVLVAEGDFTSVIFPMLAQSGRDVSVRELPLEAIAEGIDSQTDLVAVSAVQSADGRVADLDALAGAGEHHDVPVLLDATQACGWMPIDASRFDYVVAGAYKWMWSPRGTSFMAIRPDAAERLVPHWAGWYAGQSPWTSVYGLPLRLAESAKRFDTSPAWSCWAGTAPSLELLCELGAERIGAYDMALADRLRTGLGVAAGESPIVTCAIPDASTRLERAGVKASVRAGRVRLSCHLPATEGDVDLALDALMG